MQDWMESKGFTPLYFFVAMPILFVAITEILFCPNPRKDCFDEAASCFRLDEKADLSVNHPFPKLALGRLFVGSTPLVNKVPKIP